MEKLHKLSCDCSKSEIDLFSIPPTQTTIEQGKWVEFFPVTSIADATPIQFHLQSSPEEYTDLSQTLLHLKAKIVNADGTALTDESSVAPVNLFLHSLFSEVDVMFNDTLITPSTNTYPYRAMFENLLTYGRDAKLSQLTSSLFYKDTAGYMEINDPLASSNTNEGLNKRHEFTKLSKTVDMVGRLHVDASFQDRLIMGGVDIKFKLHRSKNAFSLMSSTPEASYKVKITEASLLVRRVKLSPTTSLLHAKTLETETAKYPIRRVVTTSFSIPKGQLSFTRESLVIGQIPKRMVIGCVSNTAYNGSYARNPFNFHHYDLNYIALYANSEQVPWKPLRPQFTGSSPNYILAYQTLFSGTNSMFHDKGNHITRDDYGKGYALYAFDLTPDLSTDDYFQPKTSGSVRLELTFASPLSETVNVVVYSEFESILEVDRNRNVTLDYGN